MLTRAGITDPALMQQRGSASARRPPAKTHQVIVCAAAGHRRIATLTHRVQGIPRVHPLEDADASHRRYAAAIRCASVGDQPNRPVDRRKHAFIIGLESGQARRTAGGAGRAVICRDPRDRAGVRGCPGKSVGPVVAAPKGDPAAARKNAFHLIDSTEILSITANLGDTKTTITHPASTSHGRLTEAQRQSAGITQGMIRVAIGLEDAEDLKADLARGLESLPT